MRAMPCGEALKRWRERPAARKRYVLLAKPQNICLYFRFCEGVADASRLVYEEVSDANVDFAGVDVA